MEFYYAATGRTAALREWLTKHPERVNVPSPATNYTLLYTAVKNRDFTTTKMIISEFGADLKAPCGGIGNTCLHAAAANCDVQILSFLLSFSPVLQRNKVHEYPIDVALKVFSNCEQKAQCVRMLRLYEQEQQQQVEEEEEKKKRNCFKEPSVSFTNLFSAVSELSGDEFNFGGDVVKDMSDKKKNGKSGHFLLSPPPPPPPLRRGQKRAEEKKEDLLCPSTTLLLSSSSLNSVNVTGFPHKDKFIGEFSDISFRNERKINEISSKLPLDIKKFYYKYGNGFTLFENSRAYKIYGLLPYNFKGVVYYTPVILILRKLTPVNQREVINNGGKKEQRDEKEKEKYILLHDGKNNNNNTQKKKSGVDSAPIYRAIIDRKRLQHLYISRRATYIDPYTGVIIPCNVDSHYRSLLDFVQFAVLDNFERVPPLTRSENENVAIKENIPLFKLYPNKKQLTLRILRDISIFCDGALIYDVVLGKVDGFLPVSFFVPLVVKTNSSDCVNNTICYEGVVDDNKNNKKNNKKYIDMKCYEDECVYETRILIKLPVSIIFDKNGDFKETPRVYFTNTINSTNNKNNSTVMGNVYLSEIIYDSTSGEVDCSKIDALQKWKEYGSLFAILLELQKKVTLLLEHNLNKKHLLTENKSLFVKKEKISKAPELSNEEINEFAMCVICMETVKSFVLLPCRHFVLCRYCGLSYKDRLADKMLCPMCRTEIKDMLEVIV